MSLRVTKDWAESNAAAAPKKTRIWKKTPSKKKNKAHKKFFLLISCINKYLSVFLSSIFRLNIKEIHKRTKKIFFKEFFENTPRLVTLIFICKECCKNDVKWCFIHSQKISCWRRQKNALLYWKQRFYIYFMSLYDIHTSKNFSKKPFDLCFFVPYAK